MKEYDKIPAQAVVEVTTSWGRTCLREIGRDLKEGTVLEWLLLSGKQGFRL